MRSIIFNTDSYKVSMWKQYPVGTEYVFSYIEARDSSEYNEIMLAGVRDFIVTELDIPVTREDVELANALWNQHGEPFNYDGWMYIVEKLQGRIPVRICSVPEGTVVPAKNVLVTVENTDPNVPWITTWVETALLRSVWYASSVATVSYRIKKLIASYLNKSGDMMGLPFKLHDFGARGTTSQDTAGRGGLAHLYNFLGTDTFSAILRAKEVYGEVGMPAFSIPAAEHSTITSWGRENENKAYANMVKQFSKVGATYAVVSDSYDIVNACRMWVQMKDQVVSAGGTLVIRPDSGDPLVILPTCVGIIAQGYGYTLNDKNYKVLNNVRFIWGDGINEATISRILELMVDKYGYSADNFAFGMGAALLNKVQRDDAGWAMKCSAIRINGVWYGVSKSPIDQPLKKSREGRVTLMKDIHGEYYSGAEDWVKSELIPFYDNLKQVNLESLADIRARSDSSV